MAGKRITKLLKQFDESDIDILLIIYPPNLRYFTGFRGDNGALVINHNGDVKFYTDGRYTTQAEVEVNCCPVEEFRSVEDLFGTEIKDKKIGIDGVGFSFARYSSILKKGFNGEFVDVSSAIYSIRASKDLGEVYLIQKAITIQEKVVKRILDERLWEQLKEKELARLILCNMLEEKAEREAFDTIVAYDSNSALPHAIPGDREFAGDVVLIDWGAVWNGYHSDQTVTVIDTGNPRLKEMYQVVKDAQLAAMEAIKPGIRASELDRIAREYIEKHGYGEFFKHSLGHGVGLEIHEKPFIGARSEDILEEGMVFTVEPGIYVPGIGGVRLEDMVLVTESGYQKLTQIDK